jgi:shikimate dehydrogenase
MNLYGLIGFPLNHSFSPEYFNEKFQREGINAEYKAIPLTDIKEIHSVIENNPSLIGFNVTVPYKEQIIDYLQYLDHDADKIHSVNTVLVKREDKNILEGYNTDIYGFKKSIDPLLDRRHDKDVLVLGTGGTSKSVVHVLKNRNMNIYQATRGETNEAENLYNYKDIQDDLLKKTKIVINTTPLGMYPNINQLPDIPYNQINSEHLLFDVVYNPKFTLFLKEGHERGATVKNGYEMLIFQAEKSWEIWNDQ